MEGKSTFGAGEAVGYEQPVYFSRRIGARGGHGDGGTIGR
ncbi:hypothetical protein MTY_1361 [Moorella thermoacetica Y72]|uniref:Uncharacterized protein n=1 Tax=Moorella thermoacetica Y72 TaxID=1325331 RepID=A0A0S6UDK6_NEOTH|nr:hypothetical protein MTY_1361 [Moorella thermoacetica Y72]